MSAPPVRIESKAWTDTRYETLALHLGCDFDHALMGCVKVWRWQTEHYTDEVPTYVVHRAVVDGALKSLKGAEALVAADLAELEPDGRLRIRGGRDDKGKSRIDWLFRDRERNREKGRARHEKAARDGGRFVAASADDQQRTSRAPAAHQPDVGTRPAEPQPVTSSLVSVLRTPDPEVSLTTGVREGETENPPAEPVAATSRGRDLFAALAEELHDRHAEEARKLKAAIKGCEGVSVGGGPLMGESRAAVIGVVSRWAAEARDAGVETREHVVSRMDHLVAVRAATARRERHLRWWTAGRFWRWEGIEIDLGQTVEQVRAGDRPREGSRFDRDRGPAPPPAAPSVAETQRQLEEQRGAAARAAADRESVAADLARAKEALGVVGGLARKLGGQR